MSAYFDYPPQLTLEQREYLIKHLKDWSIVHGLVVRPSPTLVDDTEGMLAATAPVTLFPSPFPRCCFEEAISIQTAYNELYSRISGDETWLGGIIEELAEVDEFIAGLWAIHLAVKDMGYTQDISLGLFRSDYMIHIDSESPNAKPEIKQVEFNTIASSFGGLSAQVSALHGYLYHNLAYPSSIIKPFSFPENPSISSLASGLAAAGIAYGTPKSRCSMHLAILFLVRDPEFNVFDQRHLEYELQSRHNIRVYRLPFSRVLTSTTLDAQTRALLYHPPHAPSTAIEITVAYLRAGYDPAEYMHSDAWSARLHLEKSAAIKCPSVLTHLAGAKKIQQVLASPSSSHLTHFLSNPAITQKVRNTFTNIFPLDDSEAGLKAQRLALNPETARGYVLKPQREGGGNNIYRDAIPSFLRNEVPKEKWKGYILMELIEPPALSNSIFRNGEIQTGGVVNELGVFGVCLWRNAVGEMGRRQIRDEKVEILENFSAGYLLRTKRKESEEGGVAAGFGSIDSAFLVDT